MGCGSSTPSSSMTSLQKPPMPSHHNHNHTHNHHDEHDFADKPIGFSNKARIVPDPGGGRPSSPPSRHHNSRAADKPKFYFNEKGVERPKTGEESAFELNEDGEIGDGSLGLTSEEKVKALLSTLPEGQLFEDPDFPAAAKSLFFSDRSTRELEQFTWKRPFELADRPSIYVDGTSRKDVIQGILGDCWLLSTCAAVAKREDLLHRVLDPKQPLKGKGYNGMIKIRLWRYGHWEDVFIDDRLPQRGGSYCYARCCDPNEFWVALVEKAMAKLHGSYEAIEGGMPIEAMVDLTGGLAERYELKNDKMHDTLYRYLRRSFQSQAFITCSRKGDWRQAHKADQNGLVQGHAYTITGLYRVEAAGRRVHLIRVRNPWGDKNEWIGDWSDNSELWKSVAEKTKRSMGLHNLYDGEFWMEFFDDFCREFEEVSICTLGPDFNHDGSVDQAESVKVTFGEWIPHHSAGGCRNNLGNFATNPQFLLTIEEADDHAQHGYRLQSTLGDDSIVMPADSNVNLRGVGGEKCQVIISLAQEHRRSQRDKKVKLLQIGFCVYPADKQTAIRLDDQYFMYNYDMGTSGPYINYREVFSRFELAPGKYVIIPATFEPDCGNKFMIRVYSGKPFKLSHLK